MIASITSRKLEEGRLAAGEGAAVPCQVRGGGVGSRGQQRHDRRVVAPMPLCTADPVAEDLGHDLVLGHSRLDPVEHAGHHLLGDGGGPAHAGQLFRRLDAALPVHQPGGVGEGGIAKPGLEHREGTRGEIVIVHFHADPSLGPARVRKPRGEVLHRVALGGLHIVVGITPDPVITHPDGAHRAVGVLTPAPPDRIRVGQHDHPLMHVEGPAIIGRQPVLVRRIRDEENVETRRLHRGAGFLEPAREFLRREGEVLGMHDLSCHRGRPGHSVALSGVCPKKNATACRFREISGRGVDAIMLRRQEFRNRKERGCSRRLPISMPPRR